MIGGKEGVAGFEAVLREDVGRQDFGEEDEAVGGGEEAVGVEDVVDTSGGEGVAVVAPGVSEG